MGTALWASLGGALQLATLGIVAIFAVALRMPHAHRWALWALLWQPAIIGLAGWPVLQHGWAETLAVLRAAVYDPSSGWPIVGAYGLAALSPLITTLTFVWIVVRGCTVPPQPPQEDSLPEFLSDSELFGWDDGPDLSLRRPFMPLWERVACVVAMLDDDGAWTHARRVIWDSRIGPWALDALTVLEDQKLVERAADHRSYRLTEAGRKPGALLDLIVRPAVNAPPLVRDMIQALRSAHEQEMSRSDLARAVRVRWLSGLRLDRRLRRLEDLGMVECRSGGVRLHWV